MVLFFASLGCEGNVRDAAGRAENDISESSPPQDRDAETFHKAFDGITNHGMNAPVTGEGRGKRAEELGEGPDNKTVGDRKVIFAAQIHLKVVDLVKAEEDLQKLTQDHKGYTASTEVGGARGTKRNGTWRLRVPSSQFDGFRESVKKLGELVRYKSDSQEVTKEYIDLQARIKNKEAELESLRKIFDRPSGKIEDVLAVQREVSRAQGELEQMKSRESLLNDLVAMTTVTVQLEERDVFVPGTKLGPAEPEAFGSVLEKAFFGSIDLLVVVGKAIVIGIVAASPWLPVILLVGAAFWLTPRRRRRIAMANGQSNLPTPPS